LGSHVAAIATKEDVAMKRGRFSEEKIVGILKEHEAERRIAEVAREHGVSEATLYGWKSK
jgi:putative transposase